MDSNWRRLDNDHRRDPGRCRPLDLAAPTSTALLDPDRIGALGVCCRAFRRRKCPDSRLAEEAEGLAPTVAASRDEVAEEKLGLAIKGLEDKRDRTSVGKTEVNLNKT